MASTESNVYKILLPSQWPIDETKAFPTEIDERDGFVHLSTASQALRVANLFYSNQEKIILLEIPVAGLKGDKLKWEAPVHPTAVDGQKEEQEKTVNQELYPHLYGKLSASLIAKVSEILSKDGVYNFEV
ncbi:UNVERIFIED_CONTAM: hypothetical protein HDU68_000489 [Siphonaria sp. JEL0065]|nr:hypothetical protein HDU68_000489 [Siphonaria sp. JEL0065]